MTILKRCREQNIRLVVIGTSAGGVDILRNILNKFKKPSNISVAVVIHLPSHGRNLLPKILRESCDFDVEEPYSQEDLKTDTIFIAPPDYHLNIEPNLTLSLSSEGPVNFSRPSIDLLFESAAHALGPRCLALLLTGANNDGARGLSVIYNHKGIAIVQSPDEAEYETMPLSGLALTPKATTMTIEEMGKLFHELSGAKE